MLDFNDKTQLFFNNAEKVQADINNQMVFLKGNKWLLEGKNGEYGDNAVVIRNNSALSVFSPSGATNPYSNFAKKTVDLNPGRKYKIKVWSDKNTYVGLYNANGSVNFAANFSIPIFSPLPGLILPETATQIDYTFDYTGESVTQLYVAIYCPEQTVITYPFLYDIGALEMGGTTFVDKSNIEIKNAENVGRIGMSLKPGIYTNLTIYGINLSEGLTIWDRGSGANPTSTQLDAIQDGNNVVISQCTITRGVLSIFYNEDSENGNIEYTATPISNADSFGGYGNKILSREAGQLSWSTELENYNLAITFDSYSE